MNQSVAKVEDERLIQVINKMAEANEFIAQLTACIYQESSEELILKYRVELNN